MGDGVGVGEAGFVVWEGEVDFTAGEVDFTVVEDEGAGLEVCGDGPDLPQLKTTIEATSISIKTKKEVT